MNTNQRREDIKLYLTSTNEPVKGGLLAKKYGVSRQVIVQDIAILRAGGLEIMATPQGYIIPEKDDGKFQKVIAVNHTEAQDIEEELNIIVDLGGKVLDVIVEHELYGEIKGLVNVKNRLEVKNFLETLRKTNSNPISNLTGGIHFHTIECETMESYQAIIEELKKRGYLIEE